MGWDEEEGHEKALETVSANALLKVAVKERDAVLLDWELLLFDAALKASCAHHCSSVAGRYFAEVIGRA